MLLPPRPMAKLTWSALRNTFAWRVLSSSSIDVIFAGLRARETSNCSLSVQLMTSMFSFFNSRTMLWMREPFMPTHAPTGSMRSS